MVGKDVMDLEIESGITSGLEAGDRGDITSGVILGVNFGGKYMGEHCGNGVYGRDTLYPRHTRAWRSIARS